QRVLFEILQKRIQDANILRLAGLVVESFSSTVPGKGLPLGNLTSQLLVNVYMNEFDQFMKHKLKAKYYIRYADDFVVLSGNKKELEQTLRYIVVFLRDKLKLELHPNKVSISTIASGMDFLGWVHFPDHRVLRTTTKHRVFRRTAGLEEDSPIAQSYLGLLQYGNAKKLRLQIENKQGVRTMY
ncbi:MAG TPA: RNA-directed DNA polymerase, partial [Candidatus Paceibacterota bacterium]|nr:RNA-directed DNA polymerase [Candidatus Paceibacterota bacterium]